MGGLIENAGDMLGVASNDLDDGLSALTEALAAADEHAWCELVAEILRPKGELLLKRNESNAAEAQSWFQRAVEISRESGVIGARDPESFN